MTEGVTNCETQCEVEALVLLFHNVIIIIINCNWVVTRWQWLFYMYTKYESCYHGRRLISNAHSKISRKRENLFKQTKVGSKVQYFNYKLTYLFFDIVALSFNTFFPT